MARSRTTGGLSIEVDGLVETLAATKGLSADLERPQANGELRSAAGICAGELAVLLVASAAASGVPVAPRVARSIRVKRDRIPVVSIGGATRVGARGAAAGNLVWGSEHGPRGDVNHFATGTSSGHWIKPAVDKFGRSGALVTYRRAVVDVLKKWRLA